MGRLYRGSFTGVSAIRQGSINEGLLRGAYRRVYTGCTGLDVMSVETLLRVRGCLPVLEYQVCVYLIEAYQFGQFNVDAREVEEIFDASLPRRFAQIRYAAWLEAYGIQQVELDGLTYIRTDTPSLVVWSNCIQFGSCDFDPPPCQQIDFLNRPEP